MKRLSLLALAALSLMPHYAMAADSPKTNADKITDFAIEKLQSAFSAAEKAMPVVTEKVLEVTSWGCIVELAWSIVPFGIFLATGFISFMFWYHGVKKDRDEDAWVPTLLFGIPSVIVLCVAISNLFSPWMWVCVYHPDIYLIHQAIEKVVN